MQALARAMETRCGCEFTFADLARDFKTPPDALIATLLKFTLEPSGNVRAGGHWTRNMVFVLAAYFEDYAVSLDKVNEAALCVLENVTLTVPCPSEAPSIQQFRLDLLDFSDTQTQQLWQQIGVPYIPSIIFRITEAP